MYISELRIRNFRNFRSATFCFSKGVNTLIGENGSGKTNALYAVRLLLDETLNRNATRLSNTDFSRTLSPWNGHWIVISIDFKNLDPSEGCQMLKHSTGHMDGSDSGTCTFCFRPNLETRSKLFQMYEAAKSNEEFIEFLGSLTTDDYEAAFFGRGNANFIDDAVYQEFAGDLDGFSQFPNPEHDDQSKIGIKIPSIHNEVSCTFAPALRDVVADLRGYRSNPLLGLLRGTESDIALEDSDKLIEAVASLNSDISKLPEIKKIADGIQDTLHSTVGQTYAPAVSVESALPGQLDHLLQKLSVKVGDRLGHDFRGDLAEQGLGGANLIYLALKLLEYEVKLSGDRVAHYLLIEEPEAHIHTHIQKTLFENQETKKTQVIVSTHSTHISSASKIKSCNVLAKNDEWSDVYQPANQLDDQQIRRVERYLDAVRSTLLFAKGVLLVEGEAELILIPALVKAVFGISPDQMGISVIAMNSAFFTNVALIFDDERVRRRCAIATDLDKAFIKLPDKKSADSKKEMSARRSEKTGLKRKLALDEFCKSNEWVSPFYAKHTFEVDFLSAGNSQVIINTLGSIYIKPGPIEKSKRNLSSGKKKKKFSEVLRLANKVGKGWFSLLVAEKLDPDSQIPSYILEALSFATNRLSLDVLKQMGQFRINQLETLSDLMGDASTHNSMTNEDFLKHYETQAPDDVLTKFLKLR